MKASLIFACLALGVCHLSWAGSVKTQELDFKKASEDAMTVIPGNVREIQTTLSPEAVQQINTRYVENLEWQLEFSQRSWNWHFYSTIFLFFIVLMIVAFGLRITYLQFQKDYRYKPSIKNMNSPTESGKPLEDTPTLVAAGASTTMKLTAEGLELSSQIIGLFVLGFSLAFFYLYVKEVYPVQVVNLNQSSSQEAASKSDSNETRHAKATPDKP